MSSETCSAQSGDAFCHLPAHGGPWHYDQHADITWRQGKPESPLPMNQPDDTWTLLDSDSRPLMIAQIGEHLFIDNGTVPPITRRLDGMRRDLFDRCWQEAERRAEAHAGRRDGHGEADS